MVCDVLDISILDSTEFSYDRFSGVCHLLNTVKQCKCLNRSRSEQKVELKDETRSFAESLILVRPKQIMLSFLPF